MRATLIILAAMATGSAVSAEIPATQPTTRATAVGGEIRFDGTPLVDAIDYLRDISRANISVNWNHLEAQGIDRNTPISLRVRNIRFGHLLKLVLEAADARLAYTAKEGVISVYVAQIAADPAGRDTRIYEITDLLYPVLELEDLNTSGGGGGTGRGRTSESGSGNSRTSGGIRSSSGGYRD